MIQVSEHPRGTRPNRETHPIEAEHLRLRACAEHLEGLLARLARGTRTVESEAQQLLEEFRRRLGTHLDAEEQSGVLERAAKAEPRFTRRIDQLLAAHHELREGVAELVEGVGPGADWTGVRSCFVAFRSQLERHEREENDVLQRVYLEDLGGRG